LDSEVKHSASSACSRRSNRWRVHVFVPYSLRSRVFNW